MKRMRCFFVLLSLTFVLTGCWDQKELEERSYVVAIGLDLPKGIDIEKEQAVDVTFQFSNPKLNIKGASPSTESEIRGYYHLDGSRHCNGQKHGQFICNEGNFI